MTLDRHDDEIRRTVVLIDEQQVRLCFGATIRAMSLALPFSNTQTNHIIEHPTVLPVKPISENFSESGMFQKEEVPRERFPCYVSLHMFLGPGVPF